MTIRVRRTDQSGSTGGGSNPVQLPNEFRLRAVLGFLVSYCQACDKLFQAPQSIPVAQCHTRNSGLVFVQAKVVQVDSWLKLSKISANYALAGKA